MSFLSGILDIGKSAVGFLSGNGIVASLAKTALLGLAVRKLSQNAIKENDTNSQPNIDQGVRLQAKPNSAAKIPVLYGSAFFGGNISDAALTNANKTMWYCLVLSEKTGTVYSTSTASSYVLNNVYWNNQRIIFNADGVTANYTVDSTGVIDRNISGQVRVYFYAGGRTAGQLPSGYSASAPPNAETLFPNWTSGTHAMSNLVFALVRVDYNREKGITGLGDMLFNVTNSMLYPGDVLYDYLTDTTYGAGITAGDILTADISALNTYSQDSVAYDSPSGAATLADRYQINGLIDTDKPVLENAEKILNASASWLSYDSHEGKWGIVINKTASSVATFTDANVIGTVSLSGTGLQDLYNQTKVEFPHRELRDSADFYNIAVPTSSIPADWTPFSLNTNEEPNILNLTYDIINEPIQAQMLGLIELKQSRLDKVIQFKTDFSYYNLKAGDIISVTNSRFGFSSEQFRIITINELQDNDSALMMEITALQYNTNVYSIADLYRFTRTTADGIISFGSIGTPGTPVVTKIEIDSRPRTEISSTAPTGVVEGMEFWLTTDTAIGDDASRSYTLIGTKKPVGGGLFTSGTTVLLEYVPNPGNFYIKTRGFNTTTVGSFSTPSGLVEFTPTQTTDAINPDTGLFDSSGGLLGALALFELLSKLSSLFGAGDSGKSIFDRIFEIFEDETGVDLVGEAAGGGLVVSSNLITKADGTNLTTNTASLDFLDPVMASGSSNIQVKLIDGTANKDILAWDASLGKWRTISGCISCDFTAIPEPPTPAVPCSLTINSTLPASNFSTTDNVCVSTTTVPFTGSYFIKFAINPGNALGGAANPAIALVNPLARGTGSFKLYGTDGTLIQSLSINSCIIHNDVVEIPFAARAPGQDYYVIWEEGIVTNCTCENAEVNNATTWTFTTSEIATAPYTVAQIAPTFIASDGETNDQTDYATQRSLLQYTQVPLGTVCSTSQKLILDFASEVIKGSGTVLIKDRESGSTVASLPVASATIISSNWTVDFGTISGLQEGKYYDIEAPEGLLVTPSVVGSNTVCDKTTAVPAPPQRRSQAKSWGFYTQEALRVVRVEYCPAESTSTGSAAITTGAAKKRTNIKIVFNKQIGIKATAPAEITINEGIFGTLQKIDLRGTYATKKYGDIYDIGSDTLVVNPTKMMKGATSYYITIPSGVIIDLACDKAWAGVSDSTTISWRTSGAEASAPQGLSYGSVLLRLDFDRKVIPGSGKMTIITPTGKLKTQIDAKDYAVKIQHNTPF